MDLMDEARRGVKAQGNPFSRREVGCSSKCLFSGVSGCGGRGGISYRGYKAGALLKG